MRRFAIAVFLAAGVMPASAADPISVLRGALPDSIGTSRAAVDWSGYYFGATFGRDSTSFPVSRNNVDLARAALDSVPALVGSGTGFATWTVSGNPGNNVNTYGGFIGYNAQWDNAVVGLEATYHKSGAQATLTTTSFADNFVLADANAYDITSTSSAWTKIRDYGTARLRLGWATGSMLFYVAPGLAFGRIDYNRRVTMNSPAAPLVLTRTEAFDNVWTYGYSVAGGVDVLLASNVFLRGEIEHVRLGPSWQINTINSARVGGGIKF